MDDIGEQNNLVAVKGFEKIIVSLSTKLEQLLVQHNAEFPSKNPQYKGLTEADKKALPAIEKHVYNAKNQFATIHLTDNKTPLDNAYVLVKGKKDKRYVKLSASIKTKASAQTAVTAKLPADVVEYLFVLIDNNNFMIKSDLFKVQK